MNGVIEILLLLLQLLWFAIFARAIVSWFPVDPNGPIVRGLDAVTEPILEPLRRVVPRLGMMDLTPMVAIVLILVISKVLRDGLTT